MLSNVRIKDTAVPWVLVWMGQGIIFISMFSQFFTSQQPSKHVQILKIKNNINKLWKNLSRGRLPSVATPPKALGMGHPAFFYLHSFSRPRRFAFIIVQGEKGKASCVTKHSLIFILSAKETQFWPFPYYLLDLPYEPPASKISVCLFLIFNP